MDWRHKSACKDEDPELFFPVSEVGPGAKRIEEAKAVCARCPVGTECEDDGVAVRDDHGIRNGKTSGERRNLTRTFR